jgi:hypothetical protein
MALGRRREHLRAALATMVLAVLLVLTPPLGTAASITGTIGGSGSLGLTLTGSVANGSAIRSAMDGNFTPFLHALPVNATTRATAATDIDLAESTFPLSSLFGNRDGTVEPNEVTQFSNLLEQEAQLLPAGSLTPTTFVTLTLDGATATSSQLGPLVFVNATGPVSSTAPLGISASVTYQFPSSGSDHTLVLGTNLSGANIDLALFTGAVAISLSTPSATTITGANGLESTDIHNDVYGWGSASVSGNFAPGTASSASISYGPSFPTGDVLLATPVVFLVVIAALLLIRRRRRRTPPAAPPS